jgi:hypothetical protein
MRNPQQSVFISNNMYGITVFTACRPACVFRCESAVSVKLGTNQHGVNMLHSEIFIFIETCHR